ncbi:MAG: OmpA family protein [Sulfitobacter sp.]
MIRAGGVIFCLLCGPALALDLSLPTTARQTVERNTDPDTYAAPVGTFAQGAVPTRKVEGRVARSAWRLDSPGLTPVQVMRPLRAQIVAAGFDVVLDCDEQACGGFDFRFATETLPGPNMYVNIRAFHFVTGIKDAEVVTLFASTSATSAYVQIIHAGAPEGTTAAVEATASLPVSKDANVADSFEARLLSKGHVVLPDLEFETGSTALGSGPFTSLAQLAEFLMSRPEMRVALVGHTDTVGPLQGNITISRQRAASVRQRLIEIFDIDPERLDAEGMGYLSPVASNLNPAGRDANRRVEVVLLGSP